MPRDPPRIFYNRVPKCASSTLMDLITEMAKANNFTFARAKEYMRFWIDDNWQVSDCLVGWLMAAFFFGRLLLEEWCLEFHDESLIPTIPTYTTYTTFIYCTLEMAVTASSSFSRDDQRWRCLATLTACVCCCVEVALVRTAFSTWRFSGMM